MTKLKQKVRKNLPSLAKFAGDSVNVNSGKSGQEKQAKTNASKRRTGLINSAALSSSGSDDESTYITS